MAVQSVSELKTIFLQLHAVYREAQRARQRDRLTALVDDGARAQSVGCTPTLIWQDLPGTFPFPIQFLTLIQ